MAVARSPAQHGESLIARTPIPYGVNRGRPSAQRLWPMSSVHALVVEAYATSTDEEMDDESITGNEWGTYPELARTTMTECGIAYGTRVLW